MNPHSLRSKNIKARRNRARVAAQASEVKCISFQLPAMPPPLSSCFGNKKNGRGRYETDRYATWKRGTDEYVGLYWRSVVGSVEAPTVPGQVRVRFHVKRRDNRRQDLDNLLKGLCDSLTRLCVIEDDSMIVDLGIAWTSSNSFDGAVLVEIESVCRPVATEAT